MKIGIISDTHTRFGNKMPKLKEPVDLLVMAGDIGDPYHIQNYINENLKGTEVIYIAGNHEYYGHDFDKVNQDIFNNTSFAYNNFSKTIGDKTFHMATLWTDLSNPIDQINYDANLSDKHQIKNWSANRAMHEYGKSLSYLKANVKEGDIVVTHHSPSFQSMHPKWRGSNLNPCFHSNLDSFILDAKPSLWIHGHTHEDMDYMIGDTRIICNPMGYPHEYSGDYEVKVIDVD